MPKINAVFERTSKAGVSTGEACNQRGLLSPPPEEAAAAVQLCLEKMVADSMTVRSDGCEKSHGKNPIQRILNLKHILPMFSTQFGVFSPET